MRVRKTENEPFEINLIPMIDCMLVIIIFFLVATTLKKKEPEKDPHAPKPEIAVVLPDSLAAVSDQSPPDVFLIGLDQAGRVYLGADREPADKVRLHREIRRLAHTAGAEGKVSIDADRGARYEDVVRILDLCAFEGLHNVGFHTRKETAAP
jgi:biopolymer transport protein ExbD